MDDPKEKKPKAVLVQVSRIAHNAESVLVEWVDRGKPIRGWLPKDAVINNEVEKAVLAAATPYGVPWEEMKLPAIDPEELALNLRNAGIWTKQDLDTKRQTALGALLKTAGIALAEIAEFAKDKEKV